MKYFITIIALFAFAISNATSGWQPGEPITDQRDGQTYKTVVIGTQCWMAENLNIGTIIPSTKPFSEMSNNGIIEKYCWENLLGNCDGENGSMKRGGFYEWQEAVQYWEGQPSLPVKGICPDGWHIPSNAEWNELLNKLGGSNAYTAMIKGGSSGFDALLTGYRCTMNGGFRPSATAADYRTYFWTAEQTDASNAPFIELGQSSLTAMAFYKSLGLCVRCIYDQVVESQGALIQTGSDEIDFGEVNIGESKQITINIKNTGKKDLIINSLSFYNNVGKPYAIEPINLPYSINSNESITLNLTFAPTKERTYNASLEISSNAENFPLKTIELSGVGKATTFVKDNNANSQPFNLTINPSVFSYNTIITVESKSTNYERLYIYVTDITGYILEKIADEYMGNGIKSIEWSNDYNSGKYFITAKFGNKQITKPIIIIR